MIKLLGETMSDIHNIGKDVDDLTTYALIEGPNSMTEEAQALCHLALYPDYFSDEFGDALAKEIKAQLRNYKENSVIHTEERTFTTTETETFLEWL